MEQVVFNFDQAVIDDAVARIQSATDHVSGLGGVLPQDLRGLGLLRQQVEELRRGLIANKIEPMLFEYAKDPQMGDTAGEAAPQSHTNPGLAVGPRAIGERSQSFDRMANPPECHAWVSRHYSIGECNPFRGCPVIRIDRLVVLL